LLTFNFSCDYKPGVNTTQDQEKVPERKVKTLILNEMVTKSRIKENKVDSIAEFVKQQYKYSIMLKQES
jgi:hypothetical protein